MVRIFTKEFLKQILFDETEEGVLVRDQIVDQSRWSVEYEMIFSVDDKFYRTHYSVGATEQQAEAPFEYSPDEIECREVRMVEKTIKVWEGV